MERDLFLPHTWDDLRWWVIIAKPLTNDISGGRPCNARSMVAKVEEHFKGRASKPFVLTPELCG
jgi:hypothetical protein